MHVTWLVSQLPCCGFLELRMGAIPRRILTYLVFWGYVTYMCIQVVAFAEVAWENVVLQREQRLSQLTLGWGRTG